MSFTLPKLYNCASLSINHAPWVSYKAEPYGKFAFIGVRSGKRSGANRVNKQQGQSSKRVGRLRGEIFP